MEYCKNKYGISVKKWCVTCHHGDNCKRREYNIGMDKKLLDYEGCLPECRKR